MSRKLVCQVSRRDILSGTAYAATVLAYEELVTAAVTKLGTDDPHALAAALGLPGKPSAAEDRARRWISGKNAPDYYGTVALLEFVGWLQPAAATPSAAAAPSPDRVEAARAIDETVAALEDTVAVLARLAASLRGRAGPRASAN